MSYVLKNTTCFDRKHKQSNCCVVMSYCLLQTQQALIFGLQRRLHKLHKHTRSFHRSVSKAFRTSMPFHGSNTYSTMVLVVGRVTVR